MIARSLAAAVVIALAVAPGAAAQPRPVDVFENPHDDFRRVELVVPNDFRADCEPIERGLSCRLSALPSSLFRLLREMQGGALEAVHLDRDRDGKPKVRFRTRDPSLVIISGVLDGPPRWVVQAGLPLAVGREVRDDIPFRPYPMPPPRLAAAIPDRSLEEAPKNTPGAAALDVCLDAWRSRAHRHAVEICERLRHSAAGGPVGAMAAQVVAESWWARLDGHRATMPGRPVEAMLRAAAAVESPALSARYAILASRIMRRHGEAPQADRLLAKHIGSAGAAPGTDAMMVERAGLLIEMREAGAAAQLLEQVLDRGGISENVGIAHLALGGIAYQQQEYRLAEEHFRSVERQWPALLERDPSALFSHAEIAFLTGRRDVARAAYVRFLESFPESTPHWMARIRLADLLSFDDVVTARAAFRRLVRTLKETEGIELARLRYARHTMRPEERQKVLALIRQDGMTGYGSVEVTLFQAQLALARGAIRRAFDHLHRVRTLFPDDPAVTQARGVLDRALYLLMHNYLIHDRPMAAVGLFFAERAQFEAHERHDTMFLLAGRALRRLGMTEDALSTLQDGLRRQEGDAPLSAAASLYLEMAGVLREARDGFRLGQVLDYLDERYPKHFDTYDYWLARGVRAQWMNDSETARQIYLYALNGPVSNGERAALAERIAEVYVATGEGEKAVRALEARVELLDAAGVDVDAPVRRDAVWRIAEIQFDDGRWPAAVAALAGFLDSYPDEDRMPEGRYMIGRALRAMGDDVSALRRWDALARELPEDYYGRLAAQELALLEWSRRAEGRAVAEAGLASR